jgi:hypothetical protein
LASVWFFGQESAWRLIEPMQAGRLKIFFRRPAFYEGLYANMCQFFEIARKPCLCFMRPSEGLTFHTNPKK